MVRPMKLEQDRKANVLRIRLTEEERAKVNLAAQGRTSTWARRVLLAAAEECNAGQQDASHAHQTT